MTYLEKERVIEIMLKAEAFVREARISRDSEALTTLLQKIRDIITSLKQ